MFVYSVRSATIKFICAIVLSVAVLITLVALIPTYADDAEPTSSISYSKIYENSDRIDFISQFGWQVKETPVEEVPFRNRSTRCISATTRCRRNRG